MKLHLLRHAKTAQSATSGRDFDRPLLDKGIRQAEKIAGFLSRLEDLEIHCSTSLRTRQTYQLIHDKLLSSSVHFSDELYHSSRKTLLQYVNALQTDKDVMIIGHNDGISDFASYLTGDYIHFKTCGYACLEIPVENWAEVTADCAEATDFYRPEVD